MEIKIESLVERQINKITEKICGDDENLKTIMKLDLLKENYEKFERNIEELNIDKIIKNIKLNNEYEAFLIKEDMFLTMNQNGDIIEIPFK